MALPLFGDLASSVRVKEEVEEQSLMKHSGLHDFPGKLEEEKKTNPFLFFLPPSVSAPSLWGPDKRNMALPEARC